MLQFIRTYFYSPLITSKELCILLGKIALASICCIVRSTLPKRKKPLNDEVVLVTGAGRGLGKELALKFASLKAKVVLWDINQKSVTDVATEIRSNGGEAYPFLCDVTNLTDVERTAEKVKREIGDVTILVNNAGVLQNVPLLDLVNERIKKTLEVNILAHFWTVKQFLPRMLETDHGHIVAVSSLSGLIGWIYLTDYSASKFAVVGFMESLEEEIRLLGKGENVHCTTVCPATIDTGMNHYPTSRLKWMVPILSAENTAADIVCAVQRNERLVTVPRRIYCPIAFKMLFPRRVVQLVLDFLQYNMNSNDPDRVEV